MVFANGAAAETLSPASSAWQSMMAGAVSQGGLAQIGIACLEGRRARTLVARLRKNGITACSGLPEAVA